MKASHTLQSLVRRHAGTFYSTGNDDKQNPANNVSVDNGKLTEAANTRLKLGLTKLK